MNYWLEGQAFPYLSPGPWAVGTNLWLEGRTWALLQAAGTDAAATSPAAAAVLALVGPHFKPDSGWELQYREAGDWVLLEYTGVDLLTYLDQYAPVGVARQYRVRYYDRYGQSGWSNTVTFTRS